VLASTLYSTKLHTNQRDITAQALRRYTGGNMGTFSSFPFLHIYKKSQVSSDSLQMSESKFMYMYAVEKKQNITKLS